MKNVSAGFKTMLATSQQLFAADQLTITLKSGTVLRYTDAPQDITVGANTWLCTSEFNTVPGFKRGAIKMAIGLAVESINVDLLYRETSRINALTPGAFAAAGGFDGATISIDRLLTPDLNDTSRGMVNLFAGLISEANADSSRVAMVAASDLVYLHAAFPPRLFQPDCNNSLFDARCGLNKAAFAVAGTCTAGNTPTHLKATGLVQATNYFRKGYVVMDTGINAGLIRSVKSSVSGDLTLLYPFPTACGTGDTFTVYPGCAKTEAACDAFGNRPRFGGFPFMPQPETLQMGGSSPTDNSGGGVATTGGGTGGRRANFQLQ